MTAEPVVGAAVDIGATSVHLVVARLEERALTIVADESAFLGLGERVDAAHVLGQAYRDELAGALRRFVAIARREGAAHTTLVATEPLRRAADAARTVHELTADLGVPIHVLDHEEEGLLTLLGVTGGRPVGRDLVVADIGGGSTEFVVVGPGHPPRVAGIRIGVARLTARHRDGDPPTPRALEAMERDARAAVATAPDARPDHVVIVGGTATKVLRIAAADPTRVEADAADLRRAREIVLGTTVEALIERYLLRPKRAQLLPAGVAIVEAILERYGTRTVEIADSGIREGAIVAAARAGHAWRDRLRALALGWGDARP